MDDDQKFSDAMIAAGLNPATFPTPEEMRARSAPPEPPPPKPAVQKWVHRSPDDTHRTCVDCGATMLLCAFNKDGRNKKTGRQNYRPECRLCYARRYKNGVAYRHRHTYKSRTAKPRT